MEALIKQVEKEIKQIVKVAQQNQKNYMAKVLLHPFSVKVVASRVSVLTHGLFSRNCGTWIETSASINIVESLN